MLKCWVFYYYFVSRMNNVKICIILCLENSSNLNYVHYFENKYDVKIDLFNFEEKIESKYYIINSCELYEDNCMSFEKLVNTDCNIVT
jgi:hypothetical protein